MNPACSNSESEALIVAVRGIPTRFPISSRLGQQTPSRSAKEQSAAPTTNAVADTLPSRISANNAAMPPTWMKKLSLCSFTAPPSFAHKAHIPEYLADVARSALPPSSPPGFLIAVMHTFAKEKKAKISLSHRIRFGFKILSGHCS
jgi:hypothetical protein